MTKAMEQTLRLFLIEWLDARRVALEGMIAGLRDEERHMQMSLKAQLGETRTLLGTLREEHRKDWGA